MPKEDAAQIAYRVFCQSIGKDAPIEPSKPKDAAAAELGRKGGTERAKKLTAERRKEIAKAAADKRWAKSPPA